jgi:uncharacterized protein
MPARRMTTALSVVAVVAALYLVGLGLLWRFQERIVFQPPWAPAAEDSAETIAYTTADGLRLLAYVVPPPRPGTGVVIAFHGNAMISRWMIPWARELARRSGMTVVLPEYRGYDGLGGAPRYSGSSLDARAALEAVRARFGLDPSRMTYYGHSLGSAIATELAVAHPPRVLVLESPFTSARDMAGRLPFVGLDYFWTIVSRVHYDTKNNVGALDVPVYVAHGERDVIVPSWMGKAVFGAARRKGRLLLVPEADHNDVAVAGGDSYWRWLDEAVHSGSD